MKKSLWLVAPVAVLVAMFAAQQMTGSDIVVVGDAEMSIVMGGDPTCNNTNAYHSTVGCDKVRTATCTGSSPCEGKQCGASCRRDTYFAYMGGTPMNIQANQPCPDDTNYSLCTKDSATATCFCDGTQTFSLGCNEVNYTPLCGS